MTQTTSRSRLTEIIQVFIKENVLPNLIQQKIQNK